jgi:Flp pilus assembly CpaE family ATPase
LTEVVLSVLERSQAVYLVASPELLTVNDLRRVKGILLEVLKLQADQVHLVLNHRPKAASVTKRDMEQLVGVSVDLEIPHDGKRPEEAALRGEILVLQAPRSPIAKAAVSLARLIDGDSGLKQPRGSR